MFAFCSLNTPFVFLIDTINGLLYLKDTNYQVFFRTSSNFSFEDSTVNEHVHHDLAIRQVLARAVSLFNLKRLNGASALLSKIFLTYFFLTALKISN
jgi:hypothetical protein